MEMKVLGKLSQNTYLICLDVFDQDNLSFFFLQKQSKELRTDPLEICCSFIVSTGSTELVI